MQQAGHTEAGSCLHLPLADSTENEAIARIRPVTVCGFDFMFCNIFVIVSASLYLHLHRYCRMLPLYFIFDKFVIRLI